MDSSSDKYLHKKFKKQLSIESRNAAKTRISSSDQCETETPPKPEDQTDNNKSVPNNSTNQNSIPVPNQIYASSLLRSSISVSDGPSDISKEHTNPHSTNNTISYLTSTTRVASPNIDDIQLRKSLNFDTLSVNDPKPEQSSSILQNCVYITNASPEKSKDVHDSTQLSDKSPGGKHVCPYCNLACSKPSVLQKHIRAHTNERPYPCDSCGFSFKTRSNLYKHCRSRTHANRVMGNKVQEIDADAESKNDNDQNCFQIEDNTSKNEEVLTEAMMQEQKSKPYKPRFHTSKVFFENTIKENISNEKTPEVPQIPNSDLLSLHINELINKNNSIVNSSDSILLRKKSIETNTTENENLFTEQKLDEPLNLSNKNRKRCLSEVMEPRAQKSLIKELLLKNLYADSNMQCQYCKMIFQTVTELELHKFRSCKGFTISGAKYTRSSSVNVASILTHNKNAFDDIPHISNAVFPLKSPGPFLGKTSLVESDKTKSFSFEDVLPASFHVLKNRSSHLDFEKDKKQHVKLFGGELKISHSSCGGDEKSFEGKNSDDFNRGYVDYGGKVSENRVIKSSLQSGATVLTNKSVFREGSDAMRTYEDTGGSGRCVEGEMSRANYKSSEVSGIGKYTNIADFSQKAVNLLTPNLKQLKLSIPPELSGYKPPQSTTFMDTSFEIPENEETKRRLPENERYIKPVTVLKTTDPVFHQAPLSSPVNLYVNGKVVRYVPGMPGPVIAETPVEAVSPNKPITPSSGRYQISPLKSKPEEKNQKPSESLKIVVDNVEKKPPFSSEQQQKFTRPNSLALKPSLSVMKQHHGLTPTMLNQILISPDTPRVAKKYNQHMLAGNCFSYLGLKSSTKPVYCTLNKPQPVYVPLYKKLSMYSEWRQQDNKSDKLYVSAYDSRQRHTKYSVAGKCSADFIVHSSYKYTLPDLIVEEQKVDLTSGNCESSDEYCNSRGRNQLECGLKCKKPSELKKHLKTHSLPYCYGNSKHKLKIKPRKSKVNNKTSGSSSSNLQNTIQSSESDTDDSGMDSSDESTRQQEHEAAYGLLSLSQKALQPKSDFESANGLNAANRNVFMVSSKCADGCGFMNNEELVHVTKKSFAKNKFLDEHATLKFDAKQLTQLPDKLTESSRKFESSLALRPLTYPYTSPVINENVNNKFVTSESKQELKSIRHFQVFQNYANEPKTVINLVDTKQVGYEDGSKIMLKSPPVVKINDVVMSEPEYPADLRKRKISVIENGYKPKIYRNENEVMDLSVKMVVVDDSSNHDTNNARYYNRAQENAASFEENNVNVSFLRRSPSPRQYPAGEYDNSAMETLADIATKQEKLDKNLLAKNVASEFLKLVTKNEYPGESPKDAAFSSSNELMVKSEENKRCTICSKSFNKPSQLRLHMNIHYLERPFRCDSCSVSFRTKGHLQKHERSASHHNKLSSSPTLSTSEPRPFKCSDCNIAFRIHGHLAKHLRSKMHIMRLECLAKIPFGLYAELERSNNLLTEINTTDGDQCLESLKFLAKKVFVNDPIKLNQIMEVSEMDENSS